MMPEWGAPAKRGTGMGELSVCLSVECVEIFIFICAKVRELRPLFS